LSSRALAEDGGPSLSSARVTCRRALDICMFNALSDIRSTARLLERVDAHREDATGPVHQTVGHRRRERRQLEHLDERGIEFSPTSGVLHHVACGRSRSSERGPAQDSPSGAGIAARAGDGAPLDLRSRRNMSTTSASRLPRPVPTTRCRPFPNRRSMPWRWPISLPNRSPVGAVGFALRDALFEDAATSRSGHAGVARPWLGRHADSPPCRSSGDRHEPAARRVGLAALRL